MDDRLRELELECKRTRAECEQAQACFDKRLADFKKFVAHTRKKAKPGRPGVWKSNLGQDFVFAVFRYQDERACKQTARIQKAAETRSRP